MLFENVAQAEIDSPCDESGRKTPPHANWRFTFFNLLSHLGHDISYRNRVVP